MKYNYCVQCIVSAEYAQGQQISRLADESLVPTDTCLEDELLQFAERFQEWALINKEVHESEDTASVDLNSAVTQARLFGLTTIEKQAILKVLFSLRHFVAVLQGCVCFAYYGTKVQRIPICRALFSNLAKTSRA